MYVYQGPRPLLWTPKDPPDADPDSTKTLAHKASNGLGGIREAHAICIYIYIHIYVQIHIYIYIYTHIYVCTYLIHISISILYHTYIYIHIYRVTRIERALRARRGLRNYIMGLFYGITLWNYITG